MLVEDNQVYVHVYAKLNFLGQKFNKLMLFNFVKS